MSGLVLVLRPEPGASATAARARALGLKAVTAPLFELRALAWEPPDVAGIDAVLLTSANAVRLGGPALRAFAGLPCHAVGEATAAAALEAGFRDVRTGPGDGAAALAEVAGARVLHPCGQDHLPLEREGVTIDRRTVYSADALEALPLEARDALGRGAIALVHSPRAGALLGPLVDSFGTKRAAVSIAAISPAAAAAAGSGWRSVASADRPRDEALLELALHLCKTRSGRVRE